MQGFSDGVLWGCIQNSAGFARDSKSVGVLKGVVLGPFDVGLSRVKSKESGFSRWLKPEVGGPENNTVFIRTFVFSGRMGRSFLRWTCQLQNHDQREWCGIQLEWSKGAKVRN